MSITTKLVFATKIIIDLKYSNLTLIIQIIYDIRHHFFFFKYPFGS